VRVRRLGLRLIGVGLVFAWGLAAALILLAYRPGGPLDVIVGITMLVPVGIALASVVWPPLARREVTHAMIVALGLATLLVLLPSIGGVWNQLQALGSQTLLPSLEAAYPWLLALIGTSLYAGFGQARRMIGGNAGRRRRLRIGTAIAAALTLLAGTAFGGAAIANEFALRDLVGPRVASRFGPTERRPARRGADVAPQRPVRRLDRWSSDRHGRSRRAAGGLRIPLARLCRHRPGARPVRRSPPRR